MSRDGQADMETIRQLEALRLGKLQASSTQRMPPCARARVDASLCSHCMDPLARKGPKARQFFQAIAWQADVLTTVQGRLNLVSDISGTLEGVQSHSRNSQETCMRQRTFTLAEAEAISSDKDVSLLRRFGVRGAAF